MGAEDARLKGAIGGEPETHASRAEHALPQGDLFGTPVDSTIDGRPAFRKTIDLSDTNQLPPDGDLNVRYTYLYTPSGKRVSGARRNFVVIHARWKDATGQRYIWKRTFEDRRTAMAFGGKHWSGIDETREFNRNLIMWLIP